MSNFGKLCALLFSACLVLGGTSFAGHLGDTVLQIASICLMAVILARPAASLPQEGPRPSRMPFAIMLLMAAVPLSQLIPLPPEWLAGIPNFKIVREAHSTAGFTQVWLPLSVSPHATWISLLSLLPLFAIFWSTLHLANRDRRAISLILLAAGVLSAFLGLLQLAQGPHSPLRFFAVTNTTEAVGFFANRNHFAALIYCVLLFAFAWTAEAVSRFQTAPRGNKSAQLSTLVVASFIVLVVLIAAQVMARSRAGLIISMAAIGAGLLLSLPFRSKRASQLSAARIIGAAAAVALIFLMQFGLFRLFQRFEADPLADARIFFARNTLEAANAFLPFGSGLGSFVRVYGLHEKPHDAMANTYANHAHNDILELFLETGWVGPIVAAIAGFWLSVRIVKTWAWSTSGTALIDTTLARASGFLIIFLILHSWVDYPLRTAAMMAVFAFACGLLVEPFASARESQGAALTDGSENGPSPIGGYDQLSPESVSLSVPAPKWSPEETGAGASAQSHIEIPTDSVPKAQRWGQDIKWPEAWQSKSRSPSKPN